MSKNRFQDLTRFIEFSAPAQSSSGTSSDNRWGLIDEFVSAFNNHRSVNFIPSNTICVDESMSCWYVLVGHWSSVGLPQYVALERKPENGAEIQNSWRGESG